MNRKEANHGFTLAELLVGLAIVFVLLALLAPAIQRVRNSALKSSCANRIRQLGVALHQYHLANDSLPPGCSYRGGKDPYPHLSWCARLLPYLEQVELWQETERAFASEKNFLKNPPHRGLVTVLPAFLCPSESRQRSVGPPAALLSYLGVEGLDKKKIDGLLFLDSRVRFQEIRDGVGNTLLLGERPPSAMLNFGWWYAGWGQDKEGACDMVLGVQEIKEGAFFWKDPCPRGPYRFQAGSLENQCSAYHFWSLHAGGAHFLFADGGLRFLSYTAEPIMPALASRAGGESVLVPE